MYGAMWKTFVILQFLQAALLTTQVISDPAATPNTQSSIKQNTAKSNLPTNSITSTSSSTSSIPSATQTTRTPTVKVIKCEVPIDVDNAERNVITSPILGSGVTYTCKTGYQHTKGDLTRTCQNDATWNGTLPECIIKCEMPENVSDANRSVIASPILGSNVTYTCKTGYQHTKGDLTRTCQNDASWNGTLPECIIKCEVPENAANANRSSITNPILGSNVTYTCKTGYQHTKGDLTRTCQKDGSWNGTPPECINKCEMPINVDNADRSSITNPILGSNVTYTCKPEYQHTKGDLTRICQKDGSWTGTPPECIHKCEMPINVDNADRSSITNPILGSKVTYTCKPEYQHTKGDLTRTCQKDGSWNGTLPECIRTCKDPGNVNYTKRNFSERILNSKVIYQCIQNYIKTEGNLTRTCQSNGLWSGEPPVCKTKLGATCYIPGQNVECVPNASCKEETSKCTCSTNYYQDRGFCYKIKKLGESCSIGMGINQCYTTAKCVISEKNITICMCKADLYKSGTVCIKRPSKADVTFLLTTNKTISFNVSFHDEGRSTGIYVSYISSNGRNSKEQTLKMNPKSTYTISNLTAGTCYNFTFYSFLTENDQKSRDATKTIQCTVPNPPLYVKVQHQNNISVTVSIGSGTGNVDQYFVFIENVTMFETSQLENVEIAELEPGYQYVANVWAISNGLNSTLYNVTIKTYPDSPLSLSVREQTTTTFEVDVFHGRGFVQYLDVYISNTFYLRTNASAGEHTLIFIQQLCPGNEYKTIDIKAVSHDLTSNSTKLPPTATYPNPPSHVQVQNQSNTSVSLSIFNGTGNFETYFVFIENVTFMNASYLENVHIDNLDPGNQYIAQIGVTSNGLNSTVNVTINTYPDRPQSVDVINQTTESIVINITQGQGMVQFFFIRINNTYNVTGRQGQTAITLQNLIPGTLFTEITVQAVSYELCSEIKQVMNTSTIPTAPKSATVTNKTIDSFNITIAHGNGLVEYFYIQINGITYQDQAAVESNTTEVEIHGLFPGTLYTNIFIISVSNELNGTLYEISSCATYPDIPKSLVATNQTNTTLSLKIGHGTGVSKSFYIYVDGKLRLKNDVIGETAVTSVTLSNLTAGTLYNISAKTRSNNLSSKEKDAKPHATNPNVPSQVKVTNQSEKTIELNIYHGTGSMQWFEIYLNDTFNYTISPQKGEAITVYTIPNLIPGTCYRSIYIRSTAYGLKSFRKAVESHSTNPAAPSTIISTTQSTDTIDLNIVHGEGNVDYYIIHVNGSYKVNTTANRSAANTEITLDKLIPGIMYNQITIQAFSNNLRSNTKNVPGYATHPSAPSLQNIDSSREVIRILVKKGRGSVEKYYILVNSNRHSNVTYKRETQQVNITGRTPGELYNITAIAISNNQESTLSSFILTATYPPVPHFNIVGIGSSEINMTVDLHTVGHVDIYNASFESKETRVNCKSNSFTTKWANATSATVDNLTPGAKYEITVSTISNSLTSFSETKKTIVTKPSIPKFVVSDTSIHSFTITITKGEGCVDHFEIYVDGRRKNIVPVSQTSNTITSVIDNLDDGKDFKINVLAVSYDTNSTRLLPLSDATNKNMVPVIGGAFGGVLAALALVALVVVWRKQLLCFRGKKPHDILDGRSNEGFDGAEVEMTDSRKKRPIKLSEFAAQFEEKSRNTHMGFSNDFKDLTLLSPKHDSNISQIQENRPKNRYTNILPFDHSLVKLIGIEDEPGSDFINANYIPGFNSPREYIASQGPLPSTLADFWRMVWEQNVSIIVMLTQLIERGRKKCELYWPENINEKRFFGDIIVEVKGVSFLQDYTLREIELHLGDVNRKIRHYNYLAWPDMGTPKTTSNMINFVDTVRQEVKPSTKGPMLVHCSAGVGRTGTFIIMDVLLQELRSGRKEVDIFGKIIKIRNNRVNMVQTEDQYTFIFKCIKDFNDVTDDEDEEPSEPVYENYGANV